MLLTELNLGWRENIEIVGIVLGHQRLRFNMWGRSKTVINCALIDGIVNISILKKTIKTLSIIFAGLIDIAMI